MLLFGGVLTAQDPFSIGSISVESVSHGTFSTDTLGPVCTTAPLSIFGGWELNGTDATGYFHTKQIDGIWYIIDPLGKLFISIGVTSVVRGGGMDLPGDLEKYYINNLGNWSDVTIEDIPISPRFNFLSGFKNTSTSRKDLFNQYIFPVFDPDFAAYCDTEAEKFVAPFKDNPWVLGYYSDNEISWHKINLDDYLALDASNPIYIAANQWMIDRKGEGYTVSDADRNEFRGFVIDTYASAVNTALKKHDPNHMYIGCRLHAAAKYDKYILRGIGKHVDINSINFYARWEPEGGDMYTWLKEAGKPFLITEFYTKATDSGLPNEDGAGWEVYTQDDRAHHFENFTLKLLSHAGSVGWTWFRYIDKNEANKGMFDENFQPYETLLESMTNIGKDVYNLRRHLLGQELDLRGDPACFVDTTTTDTTTVDTTGIFSVLFSPKDILLRPNPAHSEFTVSQGQSHQYDQLAIFDISGKLMKESDILAEDQLIKITDFPVGVYFLRFRGRNGFKAAKLFVN